MPGCSLIFFYMLDREWAPGERVSECVLCFLRNIEREEKNWNSSHRILLPFCDGLVPESKFSDCWWNVWDLTRRKGEKKRNQGERRAEWVVKENRWMNGKAFRLYTKYKCDVWRVYVVILIWDMKMISFYFFFIYYTEMIRYLVEGRAMNEVEKKSSAIGYGEAINNSRERRESRNQNLILYETRGDIIFYLSYVDAYIFFYEAERRKLEVRKHIDPGSMGKMNLSCVSVVRIDLTIRFSFCNSAEVFIFSCPQADVSSWKKEEARRENI